MAGTTEHAKVVVGGGCVVQGEVGSRVAHHLQGKTVEEVCGGVQGVCPVAGEERSLEEKAADHISGRVRPGRSSRGVGAGEMQVYAIGEKEKTRGVVVELAAIVTGRQN